MTTPLASGVGKQLTIKHMNVSTAQHKYIHAEMNGGYKLPYIYLLRSHFVAKGIVKQLPFSEIFGF